MNWIKIKTSKFLFFSIYSFILAFIIIEITLRLIPPIPVGNNIGAFGKNWNFKFWKPINSLGYRDYEVNLNKKKKLIVFLGDSFTAGQGVLFEETYAFNIKNKFSQKFDTVNLGVNGSSTSMQKSNYTSFLEKYKKSPDIVVYQYFGNDIQDFIDVKSCRPKKPENRLINKLNYLKNKVSNHSFLIGLYSGIFTRGDFKSCYIDRLKNAYKNEKIFNLHVEQIKDLIKNFHDRNTRVILIIFPFLNSDKLIQESKFLYINKIKKIFKESCNKKDRFYDTSLAALSLKVKNRVASFMDAHPSSELHKLISKDLQNLINNQVIISATDCK